MSSRTRRSLALPLPLALPLAVALATSLAACTPAPRAAIHGGRIAAQENIRDPLYSIDVKTGTSVPMPSGGWADAPATKDGLVFVHGQGGLAARDLTTGAVRWRVLVKMSYLWNVVPSKQVVFVPHLAHVDLLGGTVTGWAALDLAKGLKVYEVRADRFAPLAADDNIAVTIENGELVGYAATDGKERWRSAVKAEGPLVIANGRLFARSEDTLAVFNASSGALQRRIDLGGTDAFRSFRQPLASQGDMVAWIESHVLHVADLGSGKPLWKREGVEDLALANNIVVASRDAQLEGLDLATGTSKWKLTLDHDSKSLSADGDTIVARIDDETLSVIDAMTGKERFRFDLESGKRIGR